MSYNSFFDEYFSSFTYTLVVMGLLLAAGLVFRKQLWTARKYKGWLGAFYFALFMVLFFLPAIINPNTWGFGHAVNIETLRTDGNTLVVLDYIMEAGGEGDDPTPMYRVHLVDAATGEKKLRKLAGRGYELIGVGKDAIVLERFNSELLYLDRSDGHEIAYINRETLPGMFPELAMGIDQMNIDNHAMEIYAVAINGKAYSVSLADRTIREKTSRAISIRDTAGPAFLVEEHEIRDRKQYGQPRIIGLHGKDWADKIRLLHAANDSVMNPKLEFLEGRFIALDGMSRIAYILHYETTEKMKFLVTAVNMDNAQPLWQVRQAALPFETRELPPEIRWTFSPAQQGIFISANGTVLLLDGKTGKLKWSQRL